MDDRYDGHQGTIEDISERNSHEQRHERLIEDLANQNRQLDQFTHTIAHGLKAPLITISAFAGLLQRDIEAGELNKATSDISLISVTAENMTVLLDKLLARARDGQLGNFKVETPLNTLIDEVCMSI